MRPILILLFSVFSINLQAQENQNQNKQLQVRQEYLKYSASRNYDLGTEAFDNGDYEKAILHFDAALYKDAYFVEAYFSRGMVKEWMGNQESALIDYNIMLNLEPEHKEGLLSRAILNYHLAHYQEALDDFIHFTKVSNGETNRVFYRSSMFQEGTDKIITAQGAKGEIFNYIGLSYTQLNNYEAGIQYFDSAIFISKEADYYVNRGVANEKKGETNVAIKDYQQALMINPDHALASYNLGVIAKETGNSALAMDTYSEAIEQDSTLVYVYVERGILRMEEGNLKGALEDFNDALEIEEDADLYYNRGLVKEKLKDYEGAYADFSSSIELEAANELAYLSRGNILMKLKKYEQAIENYNIAIFYYPQYTTAYVNRAITHYYMNNLSLSCKDLNSAISLGYQAKQSMLDKFCSE